MMYDLDYYDRFEEVIDKYLPLIGQGATKATQIVTAVNKLVYKWFNDGDVYDNTYAINGWCNDLSSYANWLVLHTGKADILYDIADINNDEEYQAILETLADTLLKPEYLEVMNTFPTEGNIYNCDGDFHFEESDNDDEDWY